MPTHAHHSFAATYFEDKVETIEGNLVQFLYRNPHSFVHVMAPDDTGAMQRWAVEWGAGRQLGQQGVRGTAFKPGDHVIIKATPAAIPRTIVCGCGPSCGRPTAGNGAVFSNEDATSEPRAFRH